MRIHFSGVGGFGMSALAQIHAMDGQSATGSDRLFDQGGNLALKERLLALGVKLFPQDGSAVTQETELVVLSTRKSRRPRGWGYRSSTAPSSWPSTSRACARSR